MAAIRGKNYGADELVHVCKSVLHISQCPVVGNGQRSEKFWERVEVHYEKFKPSGAERRARKSLEAKWGDIKHDVSKFIGVYRQVSDLQISGTNEEDTFLKAKELYKQNHPKGKPFNFDNCFWILSKCPRWGDPNDNMASKRKSQSQGESNSAGNSPNNAAGVTDGEILDNTEQGQVQETEIRPTEERSRPIGNKRAKEAAKQGKFEQEALRASLKAQEEWAATNSDRIECLMTTTILKLCTLLEANVHPSMRSFIAGFRVHQAENLAAKLAQRQSQLGANPVQPSAPANAPSSPINATTVGEYYTPNNVPENSDWLGQGDENANDVPNDGINLDFEL